MFICLKTKTKLDDRHTHTQAVIFIKGCFISVSTDDVTSCLSDEHFLEIPDSRRSYLDLKKVKN